MKICTNCKKEFPSTTEYFYVEKLSLDGLQTQCKSCILQKAKNRRIRNNNKAYEDKAKQVEVDKFKTNAMYQVQNQSRTSKRLEKTFIGRCIYQDKRLLTLKNNIGIVETFLKMDFITKDYTYKELSI